MRHLRSSLGLQPAPGHSRLAYMQNGKRYFAVVKALLEWLT